MCFSTSQPPVSRCTRPPVPRCTRYGIKIYHDSLIDYISAKQISVTSIDYVNHINIKINILLA